MAASQAIKVAGAQGGGSGQRADGAGLNSGTPLPPLHNARRQQAATVELSYGRGLGLGLGCSGRRAPRRLHFAIRAGLLLSPDEREGGSPGVV